MKTDPQTQLNNIIKAADTDTLAIVRSTRKDNGQEVDLLCIVIPDGEEFLVYPMAEMVDSETVMETYTRPA